MSGLDHSTTFAKSVQISADNKVYFYLDAMVYVWKKLKVKNTQVIILYLLIT